MIDENEMKLLIGISERLYNLAEELEDFIIHNTEVK